jgi:hypothetical protein
MNGQLSVRKDDVFGRGGCGARSSRGPDGAWKKDREGAVVLDEES